MTMIQLPPTPSLTKRGREKNFGFTLMEMLLVTVLVSVIGLAVFNALNNGLKLWARGISLSHEGEAGIWLDKIGEDLRSVVPVSGITFKGTGMHCSFPAIVVTPADKNGSRAQEGIVDQIGAVQYRFDPADGKMVRRQANYGQALKKQWGPDQEIASGLEEVTFHYYFSGDKGFLTKMEVDGRIPAGIFIEVIMRGDYPQRRLKRFYAVPVGG